MGAAIHYHLHHFLEALIKYQKFLEFELNLKYFNGYYCIILVLLYWKDIIVHHAVNVPELESNDVFLSFLYTN